MKYDCCGSLIWKMLRATCAICRMSRILDDSKSQLPPSIAGPNLELRRNSAAAITGVSQYCMAGSFTTASESDSS